MGRTIVVLVLLSTGLLSEIARAERVPQVGEGVSLLATKRWVRFELVLGRMTAVASPARHTVHLERPSGQRELAAIDATRGQVTLRYEYSDEQQNLLVEIEQTQQVLIVRDFPRSSGLRVEFSQPLHGALQLVIGQGPGRRVYSGPSLWHLLMAHAEPCEHLLPILHWLRPDWRLPQQVAELKDALELMARTAPRPGDEQLEQLVKQLASPQFATRQMAYRQLHTLGHAVLVHLDQLPARRLDREQRMRLRQLREELVPHTGDTPNRVALWLLEDPQIWQALQDDADPARRQLAAEQLDLKR